jgi:hypothetical protein
MSTTHNDLKELIEFSIPNNLEAAIKAFPMFTPKQVQSLYEISISQRMRLVQDWGSEDVAASHFLRHFRDPHDPAQAEKIRQQSCDPSNR